MDARPRTRRVHREKSAPSGQAPRGAKQVVVPMTKEQYHAVWPHADRMRAFVDGWAGECPELFPAGFDQGYALHGLGRQSRKLPGVRLRKLRLADGRAYWLRPSFVLGYMTGTVDSLAGPLLLAAHGVPGWLLTAVFGKDDMFWHRLVERLGRASLVGSTVRDPARLPPHLAADEHHLDWAGKKGYVATTAGGGCLLGVALVSSADEARLTQAYGDFAAEATDVDPGYAPETANVDGWLPTRNAFAALFPAVALVLCFLHGFLRIRDRCRKARELHARVWEVYRAATAEQFRRLMEGFRQWCDGQSWPARVAEVLPKLWDRVEEYAAAYDHPGCHRTSNAVDRPMNRMTRLAYAGRGLHGHQAASERRLRGWALLHNFRPFAPRAGRPRGHQSPAHRLNGKRYHEHWLHNLNASTSMMGFRNNTPAIR